MRLSVEFAKASERPTQDIGILRRVGGCTLVSALCPSGYLEVLQMRSEATVLYEVG
jgi:hypothetical protein